MILSWQQKTWHLLTNAFCNRQLPHALLFGGVSGTGKSTFALTFARFILCERKIQDSFCTIANACHACRLVANNVHPNFHCIAPEKKGHAIKIDQIREMIEFATQSGTIGQYQCVMIDSAEQMNIFAANALLKTLEEPAPNLFLFLVTKERSQLQATIRSRVMYVDMPVPSQKESLDLLSQQSKNKIDERMIALNMAGGAPFKALSLLQKEVWETRKAIYEALQTIEMQPTAFMQCALNLQECDLSLLLDFLLYWLTDAMKFKCGMHLASLLNQDYASTIETFTESRSSSQLDQICRHLINIRNDITTGIHLNKTLVIENLLMHFVRNNNVLS